MSGDVQPRKRKDKKRKKDDVPVPQGYHWDPEEVMHVQVEQHDGGGRYASLVFYFLLTLLTYYSAKIMYDNRGLIGIESSIENSRFGIWFDGWIEDVKHYDVDQDNAPVIDDEDSDIILDTILDSVSEEESHSEQEDIDLDVEHTGDEEPSAESQELNKEVIGDLAEDISIDNYAIQEDDQRNIIEENVQVPMIKANNKQDHQKGVKPKYTIIYKGNIVDDYDEDQFINGMKNPNKEKEEFKNAKKFDNVKYYKTIIDYTDLIDLDPELDTSKEREIIPEDSDEDQIENENTEQEEIVDNDAGEEEHLRKQEEIKVANSEGGSMAVKIGVGLALVLVAHKVLIKKWSTGRYRYAVSHAFV